MRKLLLLSLILRLNPLICQNPHANDSLLNFVKTTHDEGAKAYTFCALGKNFFLIDYKKSMSYFDEALVLAKKNHIDTTLGKAYNGKGIIYINTGEHQKAITYLDSAAMCWERAKDIKGITKVYGNIGTLYFSLGNYNKALEYHLKALKLEEILNDREELAITYEGIGGVYFIEEKYDKALDWYKKALALNRELKKGNEVTSALHNIGLTFSMQKKYKEAIKYYNETIALSDSIGNVDGVANGEFGLGMVEKDLGETDKALEHLLKSRLLMEKVGNVYRGSDVYCKIAEIYFIKKDYAKSIEYNSKFLDAAREMGMKQYERTALQELSKCYFEVKEYEKAYTYLSKSVLVNDTLLNQEKIKQGEEMRTRFETEKKESENLFLQQKNQIQLLKLNRSTYLSVGLAGALILMFIIGFLAIRQNKMNAKQRTIQLEQQLLRSQMNPHFIFNSLIAIESFIYKNEPREAGKYLSGFARLMRMILENSREEYIPLFKEIKTLEYYLELQKLRFEDKFNFVIEIEEGIDTESVSIPPMLAQPFIENSIEHGIKELDAKGLITIRFSLKDKLLFFEVTDNGIGIEKSLEIKKEKKTHQSLATLITNERLSILNRRKSAKIKLVIGDIKDSLNNVLGTSVSFSIPFKEI